MPVPLTPATPASAVERLAAPTTVTFAAPILQSQGITPIKLMSASSVAANEVMPQHECGRIFFDICDMEKRSNNSQYGH